MSKSYSGYIEFDSLGSAERFWRGFAVQRVIVRFGHRYRVCSPGTARRKGWTPVRGAIPAQR